MIASVPSWREPAHWHRLFRCVFVAYIVYVSAKTAIEAAADSPLTGTAAFILGLAIIEMLAAAALLWRRTQVPAGLALCAIFATVAILETASGGVPMRFFYYAASVAVILMLDGIVRNRGGACPVS